MMPSPYRIVMGGLALLFVAILLLSAVAMTLISVRYYRTHPSPAPDAPRLIVPRDSLPDSLHTPREVQPERSPLDSVMHVA